MGVTYGQTRPVSTDFYAVTPTLHEPAARTLALRAGREAATP